jgi:cell division protein FtsA
VVEPRYDELFTLVQAELRRSGFEDLIAAGIVLTGGTSKMHGVVELAEEIFHVPVRLGSPQGAYGLQDITDNPVHATGVGLLHYGFKQQNELQLAADAADAAGFLGRVKGWFQSNF